MRTRSTLFLSAAALVLAPLAAVADEAPRSIVNEQIQLDTSFAGFNLDVVEAEDAGGAAAAAANTLNVNSGAGGGVTVQTVQGSFGSAIAQSDARAEWVSGGLANAAQATGNGTTISSTGGWLSTDSVQALHPGADVEAVTTTFARAAGYVAAGSSAAGNVAATNATAGSDQSLVQWGAANVRAIADADVCCASGASAAAVASVNNVTAMSRGTAVVTVDQRTQAADGQTAQALTDLYVGTAYDAAAAATANGNAATVANAYGPLTSQITQVNEHGVLAEGYLTVGGGLEGSGGASSYGVGNSAQAQNIGSDAWMTFDQTNFGAVTSYSAFSGTGGVSAVASATAFGNVSSGYLCTQCGDATLSAWNNQTNAGGVTAAATLQAGSTPRVFGSATAVGNAASFTTYGGGDN
jgi:hypothetical protein